jgi:hypothetical protein
LQNNQKCFAIMFLLSNIDTKFQFTPWSKFPKSKQSCTFQVVLFTFKALIHLGANWPPWNKCSWAYNPKNFNQG